MSNTEQQVPEGLKQFAFAMYIGQKALRYNGAQLVDQNLPVTYSHIQYPESGYLQLRHLSAITDEEAIEVAKLQSSILKECKWDKIAVTRNAGQYITVWAFNGDDHLKVAINEYSLNLFGIQYLQQQSFAISVYYKNCVYSVNDLIQMGIIKLIE